MSGNSAAAGWNSGSAGGVGAWSGGASVEASYPVLPFRGGCYPGVSWQIVQGMDEPVTQRADVVRVLADPSFGVPVAPAGERGLAWLRSTVSRFVNGPEHARRRALVEAEIDRLDTAALRCDARRRTDGVLATASGSIDVMTAVARPVPLATLARALGVGDGEVAVAVAYTVVVGPAYLSGVADEEVDAAVEGLLRLLDRGEPEGSAAAIAVLAQACEATAGLIANALLLAAWEPALRGDVEKLLMEVLRRVSPLRIMRRVAPGGEPVTLDLDAASRDSGPGDPPLAFGSGVRPCPGAEQAMALAAGVLEALLPRCALGPGGPTWVEGSPLRLPLRLELVVR
jgi:cytochrome P450